MYTSNDLVTSVKSRVNVPLSQTTFQTSDLYRFASEEISAKLIPLILKNLEEYYVRTYDITILQGKSAYTIPSRAIAGKLRDVSLVSSSSPNSVYPLDRLSPEDLNVSYGGRGYVPKSGFYLQGNQVVLYNVINGASQSLRLSYYIRPSELIDVSGAALINAIDTVNNTVTVASVPSTISGTTAIDFVKSTPGFECYAIDQTPVSLAGNVFTFASIPEELSQGDYICPATKSCIVQVPAELQPLLYQYVVCRILSAQGDMSALKIAMEELKILEAAANGLISPRVDGKAKKVISGRNIGRYV